MLLTYSSQLCLKIKLQQRLMNVSAARGSFIKFEKTNHAIIPRAQDGVAQQSLFAILFHRRVVGVKKKIKSKGALEKEKTKYGVEKREKGKMEQFRADPAFDASHYGNVTSRLLKIMLMLCGAQAHSPRDSRIFQLISNS